MRVKLGLRQREMGEMLGISQNHYSGIENGKRRPSPQIAEKIAKIFGMTLEEMWKLFYEKG